ncbi:tail tube protein [Rhizobium phage RHph_TM39]|uniref:Tail tube protein n=2 Tax=Cuauhnahuacvirus TaxID=3044696 RepID=A0A7S5R8D9_9CAUD|nr:tail tube [Rhizobium phage RHph_TM30]YP_010671498.1 tail tube [Rhizobium phage RHph_Y65]QIG71820.1 tail tube protein [Rhizobium phage RHph_TM40]QIG72181.1 tail tube protein [Rhizobium phage RHph_TM2_3B]QIG72544.1 tail tube protein [Rhizobium phage RHph_TM3_3_6]QIG77313.1 tail tube protein [Rhizobium phage RHph_TM39]QIG77577.1 tail tube protein [Rhizobium phage RHph_TM21B]QIG77931.1 tail tube protein [Rhizobium phage RHph_TM61]
MARPTIENVRNVGDWATTVNWNLTFVTFPRALARTVTFQDLNLRCESTDIPKSTGTSTEIMIRGHRVKQPGLYLPSGTITLTMNESVDNKISTFIRNWREICSETKTGVQQEKSQVECMIKIERLNRRDVPIWEYNLLGCYLEDYDAGGQLQGQSADILKPTLTISYDYFEDTPL